MALVLADRVKETSTTTGTSTYTLAGAVTGFESFASIGNGNTTYYACTLGSDFEVGIGTYTSSGTTLARTTILQSSNSDNAVNWGAGEKILFCTQPAEKAVFRDASGHIIALDGRNLTSLNASEISSGTLSEDRLPDGGARAATYGSTSDATKIDTITLDAKGRVTAVATGNTGDILGVTAGSGLSGGGTGGTVTLALDFSELTDMTADISGTTEFILQDGTTESRKAASEIGLSAFDNDAGFTTNPGAITGGTAGTGLSGGGSSGGVTLAVDLSELTDMTQTIVGTDEFIVLDNGADRRKAANAIPLSIFNNDSAFITASTTDTLTNKTLTNPTINAFSGTGDASITGDLTLTSTDAGSGEDPNLKLFRNSSSPADSDNIGTIQFQGKNDADQTTTFAEIQSQISDVTDGTEDGVLYFQVRRNGTLTSIANISGSSGRFNISNGDLFLQTGAELVFEGATSDAHETTLTVTDPTADRTITLPDATGTVLTTGNSDTPTTTTSSSDADFVLIDDGGTMKKITPSNLGITSGGTTAAFATAMAMVL